MNVTIDLNWITIAAIVMLGLYCMVRRYLEYRKWLHIYHYGDENPEFEHLPLVRVSGELPPMERLRTAFDRLRQSMVEAEQDRSNSRPTPRPTIHPTVPYEGPPQPPIPEAPARPAPPEKPRRRLNI